jgi:hypothetical protein
MRRNKIMETLLHVSKTELEAGLDHIRQTPKDAGILDLIVLRPAEDQRETIQTATLDLDLGLVGDTWKMRGSKHTTDGSANFEAQITLMNSRAIALIARSKDRWQLAGDQLYVDLDLSEENLPAGSRLAIGSVILEISATPHTGCAKFSQRFGVDAHKFVNSKDGRPLRLRGVNARVVQSGVIRVGDMVKKIK